MNDKRQKLQVVGGNASASAKTLPEKDAQLFQEMMAAYSTRRIGGKRYKENSVKRDLTVIQEFARFVGAAPWYWEEGHFEKWCKQIGTVRNLAVASQRHYQGAVRGFINYVRGNSKFRNQVLQEYGREVQAICTSDNCVPHVQERELSGRERRALSHEEIQQLFAAYDRAIEEAAKFASKDLRPLQRDKAMFYTIYIVGSRATETLKLDLESFYPNDSFPEFGQFGFVSVWGKGSKGSGPKQRTVPITHADLPPLLRWYVDEVRPHFLIRADANERAFFLSQLGQRLKLSTLEARFQHGLELAGLDGLDFVPHCLRHTSVTHESLRGMSTEAVRRKSGQVYEATTQGYMHVPDDFVRQEIDDMVTKQLDEREKGGDSK